MKKIVKLGVLGLILSFGAAYQPVGAADYPTKPITAVVTVAQGGSNDIQTRAFAAVAEKILKQPVIVINKTGASGMIGLMGGAQAAPDGYTLTTNSMSELCLLEWEIASNRKPEVSLNDFVSIGGFTIANLIIGVPSSSPWKTVNDLVASAKAKPDYYAYASSGLNLINHINTELFAKALGLKFRHVPYSGGGPMVTAIVGGHEDFASMTPSSSVSLFKGKKLRPLAVQGERRSKFLPDVPTLKEALGIDAGLPQIVALGVPKTTPMPIVEKLRGVVKQVCEDRGFMNVIDGQGDEVQHVSGSDFARIAERESQKLAKLYKQMVEVKK